MTDEYISPENVREGLKRCHTVVTRLLNDAELLKKEGRYSSAVGLSILAFEEVAKANDLRLKVKKESGMTATEWRKISFGRLAHEIKLSGMFEEREKRLDKLTNVDENYLKIVNAKLGLPGYPDFQTAQIETQFLKKIFPKLNSVKQDCFYLNWDEKGNAWTYFDKRFNEKIKKAVAEFLITTTKNIMISQKYTMEIPRKKFKDFSDKDWQKALDCKSHKDWVAILKKSSTKEYVGVADRAAIAIDSYPESKKK